MDGPKVSGPPTLPARFTRFFGREAEINEVEGLAARARVLTLTGAPGCGKTRLGIELADRLKASFTDGASFVALALIPGHNPVDEGGQARQVWSAIAWALGIVDEPKRSDEDVVTDALAHADLLLILDNTDHVVGGAAAVARHLAQSCPSLHVLATSRVPLGLPGEQVYAVPPLDVAAAVEMFTDRAELVSGRVPASVAAPSDGELIQDICRRLGPLPLAIELTAAWTRVLSPGQILDRLDDPRLMLQSEARGVSPRQATMASTIDWSYQLLEPTEQRLFDRLSVFSGGFDLDASEAVAGSEGEDILRGLSALVEHSLVAAETATEEPMRYHLLEPLRQFGAARLDERSERDLVRQRHAEYYLGMVRGCERDLRGGRRALVLGSLDQEDGNLYAALEWARTQRPELGLRLCVALATYFELRGRVTDGRVWLDWALRVPTADRRLRAAALSRAGRLAWRQNDFPRARALMEESLTLEREHGDASSVARRLRGLALVEMSAGDPRAAAHLAEQTLDLFRAHDDDHGAAWTLIHLAWARFAKGDAEGGRDALQQALEANRAAGIDAVTVNALIGLAHDAATSGDHAAQRQYLTHALSVLEKVGGDVEEITWLWIAAALAAVEGRFDSAMRLVGGAGGQSRRHGGQNKRFLTSVEPFVERAREAVGPTAADRLRAEGSEMCWDELAREALAEPSDADHPLSPREREIADLVADGLGNAEIAERLFISKRTVESHVDHVKQKLGFSTRHQIIAWAVRGSLERSS